MPYTSPPTFADGAILTAAQLNILSSDLEMLYGLAASGINPPFASLRVVADLSSTNNQWLCRHLHRYLHYKMRLLANDNNGLGIYIQRTGATYAVKTFDDGTARSATYTYSGYVDLNDPATWSNYIGAWSGATTYAQHDIVVASSVYYASLQNGNLNHEPPNATWWQSLGATGAYIATDPLYTIYVTTSLSASPQFVVDYLLESDQTTL